MAKSKVEQAQQYLEAIDALNNNPVLKIVMNEMSHDTDSTVFAMCQRDSEDSERSWYAGYLVGLSQVQQKVAQIQEKANKEVAKDREQNGG